MTWQTLAQVAAPIAIDKGISWLSGRTQLTPDQQQQLRQMAADSGLGNQRFSDQSPGWEMRTGGVWQSPNGNAGGVYNQTQSGYSTINNPNIPINQNNIPGQKPNIYNDYVKPIIRETGNQLHREAVSFLTSGETGPLLSLLGKGATYLTALL